MSDIVKRLRACHGILSGDPECCCEEAAAEVERLTAENKRLRAALRAIADYSPGKTTEALLLRGYARSALQVDVTSPLAQGATVISVGGGGGGGKD
jgi:anti-sigma factor RsiW